MPSTGNDYLLFPFTGDVSGSAPQLDVVSVAHVTGGILAVTNGGTGVDGILSGSLVVGNNYGAFSSTPAPTGSRTFVMYDGSSWQLRSAVLKYSENVGDGVNDIFNITHSLDTEDVTISLYETSTKQLVLTDINIVDENIVTVSFGEVPTLEQYRIVITG
jgi:hypothetical protein